MLNAFCNRVGSKLIKVAPWARTSKDQKVISTSFSVSSTLLFLPWEKVLADNNNDDSASFFFPVASK